MKQDHTLDEIKSLWEQEKDNYVLKAATENLEEYSPEVQETIKREAVKRGLCESFNEVDCTKNNVLNSVHASWADVPDRIKKGFFCPECKQIYLNNENECEKCNVNLESLGYCATCGKFWRLSPTKTCPKDGSTLKEKRLTTKESSMGDFKTLAAWIAGFVLYLLVKEIYGGEIFILFFGITLGIILCSYLLSKILPDTRKSLLWAISIQLGYYLFGLIVSIISGNNFEAGFFESLFVLFIITWLTLKPSIYPVVILTLIHILSLLFISLSVFSLIEIESIKPTVEGLILNGIIRIPSIVLMYKGLREIKKKIKDK